MQEVKYQIFISSTYIDLKEERDQVIKACLEMGHIPVGMEMFSAADEEQWKIITRQIDQSDYYVILIAQRYGSVVDGISYTEKEYDYAIQQGIPVLGFILSDTANWPVDQVEATNRDLLSSFKKKVMEKPVKRWSTKEELHGQCSIALMKTFNTQPRPGWIRTPAAVGPEVTAEFSRLSRENAKLREEITDLRSGADVSHLAQGEDLLQVHFVSFSEKKAVEIATTWNEIFLAVSRTIIYDPKETAIEAAITASLSSKVNNSSIFFELYLIRDDLEIIKTQFMALDLIRVEHINHNLSISVLWKLTTQGEKLYTSLAAIRR